MSLGERIKAERERLGITQDDWARAVGIHRNTQAKYEKGDAIPDINYLSEIDNLGADIDFIRTGARNTSVSLEDAIGGECDTIFSIVESVEQTVIKHNLAVTPAKKAQIVTLLYRAYRNRGSGAVDLTVVEDTVMLASI